MQEPRLSFWQILEHELRLLRHLGSGYDALGAGGGQPRSHEPRGLSARGMNRRDFIRHASLTASGMVARRGGLGG